MLLLDSEKYYLVKELFNMKQFHMTKSIFDGIEGEVWVDNIQSIEFVCILLKSYCFVAGKYSDKNLLEFVNWLPQNYNIINCEKSWENGIQNYYKGKFELYTRCVMKIPKEFDVDLLEKYIKDLNKEFYIENMTEKSLKEFKKDNYCTNIKYSYDYCKNGVGKICRRKEDHKIVGVITSNIFYEDGIELNIKVNPECRRKGIALAISAEILKECIKLNKKPYWDAANEISVKLSEKLGYIKEQEYKVFYLINI